MDPPTRDSAQEHDSPTTHWRWWSWSVPIYPSDVDAATLHTSELLSTSSPPAFHTPLSDPYLGTTATQSPYDASPHGCYWPGEPIARTMSDPTFGAATTRNENINPDPPRQIRFVSNDGQPHTKRRRILAACLTCRKRKTRCSGEKPECKTCTENGHACAGYAESFQRKPAGGGRGSDYDDDDTTSSSPHKPSRSQTQSDATHRPRSTPLQPPASAPHLGRASSASDSATSSRSVTREDAAEIRSPGSAHTTGSVTSTHSRVPYFRYFGPTAIVPGFKQMVVQMKDPRRSANTVSADSPASGGIGLTPSVGSQDRMTVDIPFYDATDPTPNAPIITELCETFFTHLGCNYPFLQRERFLRDLEDKRVDAILVDAVCAVAARFSSHRILSTLNDHSVPLDGEGKVKRAFRGHPFAQRAQAAVIETFPCPTIAVAQACLLLAYEEFGTDHDSGLWMYLGTSIRMAQDLGIQKLEGLQLEGRIGPTPKTAKNGATGKEEEQRRSRIQQKFSKTHEATDAVLLEDRRASESERIDTFYCIFFLDRAVSSGLGRPVTLRDKDIEISFPYIPDEHAVNGWPHPFPPLIRIVHMYGRVADVLNNIKEVNQVTPEVLKRLAGMEKDLTGIYQGLSPKLHFNVTNFQHYVKAEQGTNFILLHFWFHTLIVLLHQPTLLHSFERRIQQLFPDSRELSMSSAKTIADILAFAELIDAKSFIGNPFTSQPMYIAACAFLAEAALHTSQPSSRSNTPPAGNMNKKPKRSTEESKPQMDKKQSAKHTLLAAAANQNYQRCYKALKMLQSYWAGCRYVLTALDQKSIGIMDPLLFTQDDLDGEMPSTELSFTTPGWRRTMSLSASMGGPVSTGALKQIRALGSSPNVSAWSPKLDHSQAIGWSITGTTNSPAPNLSFLYQAANNVDEMSPMTDARASQWKETKGSIKATRRVANPDTPTAPYRAMGIMMPPPLPTKFSPLHSDTVPNADADADLLLSLNSPYTNPSAPSLTSSVSNPLQQPLTSMPPTGQTQSFDYGPPASNSLHYLTVPPQQQTSFQHHTSPPTSHANADANANANSFADMHIESQDIDMTDPHQTSFTFAGADMIPWLEYLPQDVLNYFGEQLSEDPSLIIPSGPGPPADHQ